MALLIPVLEAAGSLSRRHGRVAAVLAASVLSAALSAVLALPTAQAQQRGEAAKTQQRQIAPAVEGSARTSETGAPLGGTISFDDVLASPDDAAVNLAYAREMIRTGRLDIASATLERILILHPDLDRVRLLYAIVLYRLDSLDEALAELKLLQKRELSRRDAAEVARYVEVIDKRQQRHKASFTFTTGMHYDSNRNTFPKNGTFKVLDVKVKNVGEGRHDDLGILAIGTLDYHYDTHMQRARDLFLTGTVFADKQAQQGELDTYALLFDAGMVYEAGVVTAIPKLHVDMVTLDYNHYAEDFSATLRLQRRLFSPNLLAYTEFTGGYQRYHDSNTYPFASEQAGSFYSVTVGGSYVFNQKMQLDAFYRYRNKNADAVYEAYDSHLVSGRFTYVMPRNIFVAVDASLEFQDYEGADPFISASTVRENKDWSVGMTYGFPLSAVGWADPEINPMPPAMRDVVFSISGSYNRSDSNLPNYDYENWRAEALFTKRVDF